MNGLTRRIGETILTRGALAVVQRLGPWRAGWLAVAALAVYYVATHGKEASRTDGAPRAAPDADVDADADEAPLLLAAPRTRPDRDGEGEERRRTPDLESGVPYPNDRRTLH